MRREWVAFVLVSLLGCAPRVSLKNEIVLPPTIETRGKAERDVVNIGFGFGTSHFEPTTVGDVTVKVDGSDALFLQLKKKFPLDLFLSAGGNSYHAELRFYPIRNISFLGFGIGGLHPMSGSLYPFCTLYLNFPFDRFNVYLATRFLRTRVHTFLSYQDPSHRTHEEEATWNGEAAAFTLGVNHFPHRHIGVVSEVTVFDIRKGLKSYRWREDRPYLVDMPLVTTRAFMGAYWRF